MAIDYSFLGDYEALFRDALNRIKGIFGFEEVFSYIFYHLTVIMKALPPI